MFDEFLSREYPPSERVTGQKGRRNHTRGQLVHFPLRVELPSDGIFHVACIYRDTIASDKSSNNSYMSIRKDLNFVLVSVNIH